MPARRLGCRRTAFACSLLWLSTSPLCLRGILASDMATPAGLSSSWLSWNNGKALPNRLFTGKLVVALTLFVAQLDKDTCFLQVQVLRQVYLASSKSTQNPQKGCWLHSQQSCRATVIT